MVKHLPHIRLSTAEAAVAAHHVVEEDSSSTIVRRAFAEGLSALGFGGIISGFGAVVTALTHTLAPELFSGVTGLPSNTGLLLTAAVASASGAAAMLGSSAIRAQLDREKTERRVIEQQEHPVTTIAAQDMAVSPQVQAQVEPVISEGEKSVNFVEMIERQRMLAHQQTMQK